MTTIPEFERKAAFARRIGVTRQYVQKLCASGLPTDENGDVKIAEALAWIAANARQPGSLAVDEANPSLVEARTRLVVAQAGKAEAELLKLQGAVIDKETAKRAVRASFRLLRDTVLNFPNRYGPVIAAEVGCDPRQLIIALDTRLRLMLTEMADSPVPFHEVKNGRAS